MDKHHHPYQKRTTRNSPSREQRRARRLAARKEEETSEALDAIVNEVDNEKEQEIVAENVADEPLAESAESAYTLENNSKVTDEFCPNEEYSSDATYFFFFSLLGGFLQEL